MRKILIWLVAFTAVMPTMVLVSAIEAVVLGPDFLLLRPLQAANAGFGALAAGWLYKRWI
jgi:hypothetical protein